MKLKRRNKASAVFSMASLTDIVFLLLIFFIINAELPDALKLLLPNATGKTPANKNIVVSISNDLMYSVNGVKMSFTEIEPALQQAISKSSSENPTIMIRADKRVQLDYVVQLLEMGNDLNVPMILATKPK